MSYEPFALKYRPRTFHDVVGQASVAETLLNALRHDRLANAFLFCGSRGVGKTSMARILARALNCIGAGRKDAEPCGVCEICIAIGKGEDLDVIEIDGASNRGIDEIRTIRDQAGYAPARGRFKVYIIDEVHMLTVQAFNALLKTLEEPPPHVKFIFATTEARAVPDTIVSRCQRFEFRRIARGDIVQRLEHIAREERLAPGAGVLEEIARHAEGGLRDSLGLFDQLIAFAGESPTLADLERVLGRLDVDLLGAILVPAAAGDAGAALDGLDQAFESGRDADEVLEQSSEVLREVMRLLARGAAPANDDSRATLLAKLQGALDLDRALLAQRLLLNARREAKAIGEGRLQLELAILRIARSHELVPVQALLERLQQGGDDPDPKGPRGPRGPGGGPGQPESGEPERGPSWSRRPTDAPKAPSAAPGGPKVPPWERRPRGLDDAPATSATHLDEEVAASRTPPPRETASRPATAAAADLRMESAPGSHAVEPSVSSAKTAPLAPISAGANSQKPDAQGPPNAPAGFGAAATARSTAPSQNPSVAAPASGYASPRAASAAAVLAPPAGATAESGSGEPRVAFPAVAPVAERPKSSVDLAIAQTAFENARRDLRSKKPRIAVQLERAEVRSAEGGMWVIELPHDQEYARGQLESAHRVLVEQALSDAFGGAVKPTYVLRSAGEDAGRPSARRVQDDPFVRKVIETFGGGVLSVEQKELQR